MTFADAATAFGIGVSVAFVAFVVHAVFRVMRGRW